MTSNGKIMIKSTNKLETVDSNDKFHILKECSYLTVRAFFTIIVRKRTHKGEIYDKSNLWRKKRGCNLQN